MRILALAILLEVSLAAGGGSSVTADEATVHRDLVYAEREGAAAGQTSLDLYAPATGENCPIVVWIHGGGWRFGDKRMVNHKPAVFNDRGVLLASVNYRLQPATDFRGQAADIAAAVRWLVDHATEYGGDPRRIVLMGHSAGAHLAALVAADAKYLRAEQVDPAVIRGVVLLDGAGYDVEKQIQQAALMPRLRSLYDEAFGDDPADWREASPIHHVGDPGKYPPFLVLHVASRADSGRQSRALAEKIVAAGGEAMAVPCEGKTHATINREFGVEGDEPTATAMEFIERAFSDGAAASADADPNSASP